jgi:L-aminopeptidase/D-esterase-like protein
MQNNILDVPGVRVGHASDIEHGTGCTVVIFEKPAVGGVNVCGFATGTREIDVLNPNHVTPGINAVCFAGGSAYGLAAADGVMKFLEEKGIGYFARVALVPIVPAAIVFDLSFKTSVIRPDLAMGYQACANARSDLMEQGSVGAGTGVSVGKLFGIKGAVKSGVGSASIAFNDGLVVAALCVVNNLGDVLDYRTGQILAGCRNPETNEFINSTRHFAGMKKEMEQNVAENTNLALVCTNAKLDKNDAGKLARMAEAGFARTLSPLHSTFDGDIIIAAAAGEIYAEINRLGILAAEVLARAVNNAVIYADGLGVVPALKDLKPDLVAARKEAERGNR